MAIGAAIRQILGPLERPISDLYRSIFIDIHALVSQIDKWVSAAHILELGCGEGAITECLVKVYPNAYITGIDITPRVGRMFQGEDNKVTFKQQTIQDFAVDNCAKFELIVISDVMHHVPWEMHSELLSDAKTVLKPGGYLVLKDWERKATPIHLLCYCCDRYITGDRVRYKTANELRSLIQEVFGENSIRAEKRIRPWSNNITFLVQV